MACSSLPIGVRFRPTKVHLVAYFLAARLNNGGLPPCYPQFIDCDVYSDHPFNILASTKEQRGANDVDEGFFFSRLNKTTPNGKRINRFIQGHGTWLEKSKTHQVCIGNNVVGVEKYFKFKPVDGSSNGNEDDWTMHEYYLDGNNEMVLCHITRKADSKIMPLDYEGNTSKRGRFEYDQPAGCCSSGIINPIQDYVSQVLPQGYDNSALEEIDAAQKSSSLPSGALEGDHQFDIDEFIQGLSLPNGAQDNTSNFSLEGSWTDFDLDISSLPPLPAF